MPEPNANFEQAFQELLRTEEALFKALGCEYRNNDGVRTFNASPNNPSGLNAEQTRVFYEALVVYTAATKRFIEEELREEFRALEDEMREDILMDLKTKKELESM